MNKLLQAMQNRRSIKTFTKEKISQENIDIILEAGRLSPSSYGFEHSRYIVIKEEKLKEELLPFCFNQKQITSCSHLILILARLDFKKDDEYLEKCLRRFNDNYETMKKIVYPFIERMSEEELKNWSIKQTYIALANLMTSASYLGIDSCPMEGFLADKIHKHLKLSDELYLSVLLPLGYREKEPHPQLRWDIKDLVEYR